MFVISFSLSKILEDENYYLMFAASGVEALNILRKVHPDLILMDVMITGKSKKKTVTESLKTGATSFVVKPFDRDTLLGKVAQALR